MTEIMTINREPIPVSFYRLRWRFDFADRPSRVGIWNGAGRHEDGAWAVPKNGLVRAAIEAEDLRTFEQKLMFEVDGADYVSAQWDAYGRMSGMGPAAGSMTLRQHVGGLSFLTRTEKVTVSVNGTISRRPLTESEKLFKFHEHTSGT